MTIAITVVTNKIDAESLFYAIGKSFDGADNIILAFSLAQRSDADY